METEKISDIFLHLYLSNITTSGHINISVKLHSSRQCFSVVTLVFLSSVVQCLFLLWCMAPVSWNGSQIIYNKVVRPVFLRHEAMVDNMVNNLGGKAMDAAETLTREGPDPFSSSTDWLHTSVKQCLTDYSFFPSLQSWPLWWRIKFWWLRDHQALSLNLKVYPVHLEKHQQRELLRQSPAKIDQYGNYSSLISLYAKLS